MRDRDGQLEAFDGIDDPEAARSALETVKNLDSKQLIEAGEVEKVKSEAIKVVEGRYKTLIKDKYEPLEPQIQQLKQRLHASILRGHFERSRFITEKLDQPMQFVRDHFGRYFSVDIQDNVVATDPSGKEIFSRANPGERAKFDEALEILVEQSPFANHFLKAQPGKTKPTKPGQREEGTITVEEFDNLSHAQRHKFLADGGKLIDNVA